MPAAAEPPHLPLRDHARGKRNLAALAARLGPRFADLLPPLGRLLPRSPDPDLALNNLERLFASAHGPQSLPELLANSARGLDAVLHLLGVSQFFADTLVAYPDALDLIRAPQRRNPTTDELTARLKADVDAAADDAAVLHAFRRFRHLNMLRIGTNDILRDRSLEEVTRELSRLADSSVKVALLVAQRTLGRRFGTPLTPDGEPARVAAFAFGKLGGDELNYSSDIDLMFVYDRDGETNKRPGGITNAEFFARAVTEVVRLLSSVTDRGFAYRVDLRLRPEGKAGPLARSLADTLSYYDLRGRTWERQALIKLRGVGGDRELRREFAAAVEPFVYRKYFSFSEINEVKALKRRMEQGATREGADERDVKTGRGGIRDIEYTVQFLQLLNGGDLPAVRQRNTLLALDALEITGCLTPQETYILADAYRFLRKTEHRLQLLFDRQTHRLPATADELRKLALRMGYRERSPGTGYRVSGIAEDKSGDGHGAQNSNTPPAADAHATASGTRSAIPDTRYPIPEPTALSAQRRSPLDESPAPTLDVKRLLVDPLDLFLHDYHDKTRVDRTILDHLLHQTFATATDGRSEPESDLMLDPDPDDATVLAVLGRYPFRDVPAAYRNLGRLAQEEVPFLSHRRCRHFLASIAPQLLRAVADTPDPDAALNTLERVTASLGAKAVLYELFSANPPTLKLYVDVCANSPYLSAILTGNPGMVDELLDSLVLDQPRTADDLRTELAELLRGAHDPAPILHSFQDKELLRIGVADVLGKADVRHTTAALSDVADTLLAAVFDLAAAGVRAKLGVPTTDGKECPFVLLGLGKLGGREISYHSDLDLLLVYAADGTTVRDPHSPGRGCDPTTHQHYFTALAQRAIRGPGGPDARRLYEVDMRLRPTGKSGSLAVSLDEFRRYYAASGHTWERQALARGRVVAGDAAFGETVVAAVRRAVLGRAWCPRTADEIASMRSKLEAAANPRSLKRGRGGLTDVEFAVQLLQLKHGEGHPAALTPNVWDALDALEADALLPAADAADLRDGYTFLRFVEARLRLVTDRPLTEVPDAPGDLEKLARRAGFDRVAEFTARLNEVRASVRAAYDAVLIRERA